MDRHRPKAGLAKPPDPPATWWVFVLLGVAALILYLPSLSNGFVDWDDDKNFLNNLAYRGLGPAQLRWMWTTFHLGPYQPLAWMTLGLDFVLWGMNPAGYHATSAALHAMSAGLFAYVASRLFDRRGGWDAAAFGVLAGAMWAMHPLRVEAVSWITERREVLCGALSLLAVAFHLAGRRVATFVAALAAMLAKGIAVVLPVVLVLIDVCDGAPAWRRARHHAWLFVAAFGLGLIALFGQGQAEAGASLERVGAGARAALFGHGLGFYAWKTLWPVGLAPLYEMHADLAPIRLSGALGAALLAVSVFFAIRFRERVPALLPLLCAYVVFIAPVSGLVQVGAQTAADRYAYQAGWVLSLMAAAGVSAVARRAAPVFVVAAALSIPLAMLSVRQQHAWKDAESLWTHQLAVRPDTATAHYALANLHVTRDRTREADLWAEPHFREAIRLRPDRPEAYRGLGNVLRRADRPDEAIRVYRDGLAQAPHHGPLVYGLATAEWRRGDRDRAIETLRELSDCPPVTADTFIVLARALAAADRSPEAVAEYERAIAAATDTPAVAPMELAWLLATSPDDRVRDGARAVALAEKAAASGKSLAAAGGVALRSGLEVRLVKTRAAALAEAGRFDEASAILREGAASFPAEQRADVASWLADFSAHRPIRAAPVFP